MSMDFECRVIGLPAPQGSKRSLGKGRLIESSRLLKPWRDSVAYQLRAAMIRDHFRGFGAHVPVDLDLYFALRRPAYLPKSVHRHTRRPDLDKLARAVLDAMTTAGLVVDDAQVFRLTCEKAYAHEGHPLGLLLYASCQDGEI
jgi:crossover junction endodeoxyribonuclease RusA